MTKKRVLHLNAYYVDNHLYSHLYAKLDRLLQQWVYIPIKTDRQPENVVDFENTELHFEKCIKPIHKYLYFEKINCLYRRLRKNKLTDSIDFIHAHNLFTDGALALKIHKENATPYVVAIRNTDVNLQYRYMLHRRAVAKQILKHAKKVIFVSPVYRDKLFSMLPKKLVQELSDKTAIIPNGINDIWLENPYPTRNATNRKIIRLIYVGQVMKLKNLKSLVKAVELLNKGDKKRAYQLTIIGGKNQYEPVYFDEFTQLVEEYKWLNYKGKIKDANKLLEEYRASDIFVMPSKPELFGLVYIEALSQGLPIIYSKGEGIDGFFDKLPVGQSVDPESVNSIAEGISAVSEKQYENLSDVIPRFDWNKVAKQYIELYNYHE